MKPEYVGHRKRIKEKFDITGLTGWHDYEILELVLSYCIPRRDTKPIAKELITRFKSFNNILDADRKKLEEIPGISKH